MSRSLSIAIAGGGIIGLSTAWRLAQQGLRVSVFDQSTIGGEASWAGAGMLAPGGEIERPSTLADWAIESNRLYPTFIQELRQDSGLAIDFQQAGALDLAYSTDELEALEEKARVQSEMGIVSEPVGAERVASYWPEVRRHGLLGARFYPDDALVNPREVVLALSAVCRKLDVRFVQNCPVQKLQGSSGAVEVVTQNGVESHRAAVVAAGAWSSLIAFNGPSFPAASPVKGHLIGFQQPSFTCRPIVRRGSTYLLLRASGLLIAGASVEHVGFDRHIEAGVAGDLQMAAGSVMPHLLEGAPTETWVGFRPASDQIHMGRWQQSNVYLAYGHYRNGILLAPLTAEKVTADVLAGLDAG